MRRRSGRVEPGQATESLKALGLEKHQALIVAHRGGHPHVHVIVNRVDAESGKAAGFSRSKLRLSQWAEGYEQGQGWPGSRPRSVRTGSGLQRRRGKKLGDLERRSRREWAELYGRQGLDAAGSDCVRLPLGPVPVAMPERLGKPPSAFPPLDLEETGPGVWKDQHPVPAPFASAVAAAASFRASHHLIPFSMTDCTICTVETSRSKGFAAR